LHEVDTDGLTRAGIEIGQLVPQRRGLGKTLGENLVQRSLLASSVA
jgi:hypothetical protein